MRTIPLTQGQEAIVDESDYDQLASYNWCALWAPTASTFYAMRRGGDGRRVLMHRALTGAQRGQLVDHKNHNGLDNRRDNLRVCSRGENNRNVRKTGARLTSSRFKGVDRHKGKWRARITISGRLTHLGFFDEEEIAARAYDDAARAHFGEFCCLNFAEGTPSERRRPVASVKQRVRNPRAQLTEETAETVRSLLAGGLSGKDVAALLGVSASIVSRVKLGRTWKPLSEAC